MQPETEHRNVSLRSIGAAIFIVVGIIFAVVFSLLFLAGIASTIGALL